MAFDDIVRKGVALANTLTSSLQPTVTVERWQGDDGFGNITYGAAITPKAIVSKNFEHLALPDGRLVVSQAQILILELVTPDGTANRTEPFDARDKVTLPDGFTAPIVNIEGLTDPDTNRSYFEKISLGQETTL